MKNIFKYNYDFYKSSADAKYYYLSLNEFLNQQEDLYSNGITDIYFKDLFLRINNANSTIANDYNTSSGVIKFAKQKMDQVIRLINYQLSGRDLVFDSSETYTLNSDDDLLYVKEAKNDDIKSIRKTLLRAGYANIDFTK